MVAMPLPSDPLKDVVGNQHRLVRAHGQFSAQDLFVIFAADRHYGDVAADPVANLQGLFDRVVVRLIHRVHEFVALDVVPGGIELNLVLRGIGHSSHAN